MCSLRPHGRSGLKLVLMRLRPPSPLSPPTRAEWIEMIDQAITSTPCRSPPTRAEWIEIKELLGKAPEKRKSPPTRAEWIEIPARRAGGRCIAVSAHTGGVD